MTNAGVTIMSSISAIAAQAENPLLAEVLTDVGKELESGKTFSEVCAKHQGFLPQYIYQHGGGRRSFRRSGRRPGTDG